MSESDVEIAASLVLIQRQADVPVPAGTLATLISFAIAGPDNEVSAAIRDEAVTTAKAAFVAEFQRLVP